ncbi:hypothetical protein DOX71_15145 [Cronobacter sakazakii]|uniref:Uncharacterized protein n=1 Tax=Cronobacter sakazakii TaxID=28141 RepID=A0AA45BYM8_CROSK|nr:hypothetical protein [Cronobacter sakazakii]EGT5695379.1 hypothetical protein [Cronobacter sakazakii]EGT5720465.1 hypothetical protein [Cronobacter sakazakii]EGT5724394.1 hypothetical protein [Cronobacter sakazakii]PPY53345.1 hypothetical protein C3D79_03460 [Cronobacter sakazakii]
MLAHQAQLVFNQRVFHFNDLHSLSPQQDGSHKKIAGLYRFLRAAPYVMGLIGINRTEVSHLISVFYSTQQGLANVCLDC